uniref:Uncharacterized protein n=1 Tax=Solanum lycopersicum TaxID=4081 RepID=A0A3Q7GIY6_SOLLC
MLSTNFENGPEMTDTRQGSIVPQLWQPASGTVITNDTKDVISYFASSKNDSYVMSASGGKISLFDMMTFKVKTKLKGQQKRINGLAFSNSLTVLISAGANSQVIEFDIDASRQIPYLKEKYIYCTLGEFVA